MVIEGKSSLISGADRQLLRESFDGKFVFKEQKIVNKDNYSFLTYEQLEGSSKDKLVKDSAWGQGSTRKQQGLCETVAAKIELNTVISLFVLTIININNNVK